MGREFARFNYTDKSNRMGNDRFVWCNSVWNNDVAWWESALVVACGGHCMRIGDFEFGIKNFELIYEAISFVGIM